jgi:hypothetical protein
MPNEWPFTLSYVLWLVLTSIFMAVGVLAVIDFIKWVLKTCKKD